MPTALELKIGYNFKNPELLKEALRHPACSVTRKKNQTSPNSYERLEFLGDRVLGMVVADMLLRAFTLEKEGDLAKRHAGLVRGEALAKVAVSLDLGDYLELPNNESLQVERLNPSNLEDACEALIAALYLDGGLEIVQQFVENNWRNLLNSVKEPPKDAKTALQEWSQAKKLPLPKYNLAERGGSSHAPSFTIEVTIIGYGVGSGTCTSKRAAEQMAAQDLLEKIVLLDKK